MIDKGACPLAKVYAVYFSVKHITKSHQQLTKMPKQNPNIKILFLIFVLLNAVSACRVPSIKEAGYDTKAIKTEIEDRKIKRVKEGELFAWMQEKGGIITDISQKELTKLTLTATKYPLRDSLAEAYNVTIDLIQSKDLAAFKPFNEKEKEVLDMFAYNLQQDISIPKNLQKLEKAANNFVFNAPVILNNKNIGLWRILFTRKNAIRKINMKQLLEKR